MLAFEITHDIYYVVPVLVLSMLLASFLYKPILAIARRYNFYDNPEERKLQRTPVPVMGGFVVFAGAVVSLLCYGFIRDITPLIPIMVAMLIMLVVGAYDDARQLPAIQRLFIEVVVVVALAWVNGYGINDLHGLWGVYELSPWISWPLTVVSCVGIINAINMIDGIDGLSSGLCILAMTLLSWISFFDSHDFVHAALGMAMIGGTVPFLVMNVFSRKSKMYIGDAGTMLLGIAICEMLLAILTHDSPASKIFDDKNVSLIAFSLAVLSIPIFDTFRVMFGRIRRGISPLKPDKTHLHHAFIAYGFHHLEASLLEIILNILIIFFWFIIKSSHLPIEWQLYGVVVAGFSTTYGIFWLLRHNTN